MKGGSELLNKSQAKLDFHPLLTISVATDSIFAISDMSDICLLFKEVSRQFSIERITSF